mgnify:CR=1 FL=1
MMTSFKIDWVLNNELAIGRAPIKISHFEYLKKNNIKAILNLCDQKEAPIFDEVEKYFNFKRFVLPDHKVNKEILISEINEILSIIESLRKSGPIYVHCYAGIERSPIVCMSWLVAKHKLSPQRALDYLMEVHPGTNPLPSQFKLLNNIDQTMF